MNEQNNWVDTLIRHYKLVLAGVLLFVVLVILNEYVFVKVTLTGASSGQATTVLFQDGEKVRDLKVGGIQVIPKDAYSLRASTENELTEKDIRPKSFRINSYGLELAPQNSIQKVASSTQSCLFSNGDIASSQEVFSYNCTTAENITGYSFVNRPVVRQVNNQLLYAASPFRDGLLAFATGLSDKDDELRLGFVQPPKTTPLPFLANPLQDISKYEIMPFVNEDGTFQDSFVVADGNEGELTYFENIKDDSPQKISFFSENSLYKFGTIGDSVFVLTLDIPQVNEDNAFSASERESQEFSGGNLRIFVKDNGNLTEASSIKVPDNVDIFDFIPLNPNTLVSRSLGGEITVYSLSGDKLKATDRVQSSEEMAIFGGGFVYRQGGDYLRYIVDEQESRLIYRIKDLVPSSMQNYNGELIINAFVENSDVQHSFVLLDQPREDGLEKILSYASQNDSIIEIDYNKDKIFAEFALTSFTSDHATGELTFDQDELKQMRAILTNMLEKDGINSSRYTIVNP